ncbi:two-component sensor histidine kinase, partial [Streptomyces sp. 2MCAF27]
MLVFGLVALAAAVSASAIAYWLNRDAVLTRTQDAALDDFSKSLKEATDPLPAVPTCPELQDAADRMADNSQKYEVLLIARTEGGGPCTAASADDLLTLKTVPEALRSAVDKKRAVAGSNTT